jgi:hypothetical protein
MGGDESAFCLQFCFLEGKCLQVTILHSALGGDVTQALETGFEGLAVGFYREPGDVGTAGPALLWSGVPELLRSVEAGPGFGGFAQLGIKVPPIVVI